jgi:PIN domain nuclease of toxin-antitoxin system
VIAVDTHAWIWWWSDRKKLSTPARRELERSESTIVPAICCWELALLAARRKVELDEAVLTWMHKVLAEEPFSLQPLSPAVADQGAALSSEILPDPSDRLIVATALVLDCPLVTKDSRIHASGLVECIW